MFTIYRMLSLYNSIPEDHIFHSILQNMFRNLPQLPEQSIESVAAMCYTSPSSISRLVKALDYRNFTEFKYELANVVHSYWSKNRLFPRDHVAEDVPLLNAYLQQICAASLYFSEQFDLSLIEAAVDRMGASRAVHILYCGNGRPNIHPLQCDLIMSGRLASYSSNPAVALKQLPRFSAEDLLLVVLESGYEPGAELQQLTECVHNAGGEIVAICSGEVPILKAVEAMFLLYPRDLTLHSFLYCYIMLNLLTLAFRNRYLDGGGNT